MILDEELKLSKALAKEAGRKILEFYGTALTYIDSDNPLTIADREANKIITSKIREMFPNHYILTEEETDNKERLKGDFVWIIDPLDGTKEFINNIGEFTVNIALVFKGEPVLGIIYIPVTEEMYFAVKDKGAYLEKHNITKLHVSNKKDLNEMNVVKSRFHSNDKLESFLDGHGFSNVKIIGSSLKGALVASGKADVYFRFVPVNEWDICAMDIILREAGGILTDFEGNILRYNNRNTLFKNFVASNNTVHDKLLSMIKE